jgi:hypothetical protein
MPLARKSRTSRPECGGRDAVCPDVDQRLIVQLRFSPAVVFISPVTPFWRHALHPPDREYLSLETVFADKPLASGPNGMPRAGFSWIAPLECVRSQGQCQSAPVGQDDARCDPQLRGLPLCINRQIAPDNQPILPQQQSRSSAGLLFSTDPSSRLDAQNQQCQSYPWWRIFFGRAADTPQQINQIRRQPYTRFSHNFLPRTVAIG